MIYDSIVVGAGPSGLTAALYLLRAGRSVLILEKESIGGQIALSPRLENFPSIASISGEEFSDRLFSQVTDLGADFELEEAQSLSKEEETGIFAVATNYSSHQGKTVILATGCAHRSLGVPGEKELTGKGVSYCAVCDGPFYSGKDVLLIGDANTALQYAISLSSICRKVTVVTLFDRFFGDAVLQTRLFALPNVEIHHCLSTQRFDKEGDKIQTTFLNTKNKEETAFRSDGVFIAIGQIPHNEPFLSFADSEKGFLLTDERMATKTKGLFACGDCRMKMVRQVVTATGDGAVAATSANAYLQSL